MKITVLSNDKAKDNYMREHGLSFYIETNIGKKILFDTGASDVFIKNADTLGIDMDSVEFIALSHGHHDHGNGLKFLKGKTFVCHPGCFYRKYRKKDGSYNGLNSSLKEAQENFNLILSKNPYQITEDVIFLGEIQEIIHLKQKKLRFS